MSYRYEPERAARVRQVSAMITAKRFLIAGAGGFGRETLQVFRSMSPASRVRQHFDFAGFVDDNPDASVDMVPNARLLGGIDTIQGGDGYVIAVADPHAKAAIDERISATGAVAITLVHPMAWIGEAVELGDGTIVTAHSSITTNISIGRHVHINLGCTIGHDSVIEDYATLSPGVHISGNVTIKRCAGLGTGAVVLPGVTIGEGAMVGAGAVVTKDVADYTTVVGLPAKPIKQTVPAKAK